MIRWVDLFGETAIDEIVETRGYAGQPFLNLDSLKQTLIRERGWKRWTDPESGKVSAVAEDVEIWQGASVRDSIIGPGVVIGHASEVIESIILDSAKLNHYIATGRSIIGPESNLTSHVVIASNRLDEAPVVLPSDAFPNDIKEVSKFGALIGEGTAVGSHSLINPGCIVPSNHIIEPFASWDKDEL